MTGNDKIFAQLSVRFNFVSEQQISECFQLQKAQNTYIPIAQILVKKNYLTGSQVATITKYINTNRTEDINHSAKSTASPLLFCRYRVIKELGRGGMGVVYKVEDTQIKRTIALKIINQTMSTELYNKRFDREARLMARLQHPGIIKIYNIGDSPVKRFFTMELIEGEDLDKLLPQLPITQLVKIMLAVVEAVHYAHENGVIHRDLKPSNILVTTNNQPKVLDFGLAKDITESESLSQSGQLLGTLLYMSPEQANGAIREIDAQSDIYSLGAVLYHILTGEPPFSGNSQIELVSKIVKQLPTPPSDIKSGIAKDLDAICLKALEKQKSARYSSAKEMANDLQKYLRGERVSAKQVTKFHRLWRWVHIHQVTSIIITTVLLIFISMWVVFSIRLNQSYQKVIKQNNQLNQLNDQLTNQRNLAVEKQGEAKLMLAKNHLVISKMYTREAKNYHQAEKEQNRAKMIMQKLDSDLALSPDKSKNIHRQLRKFRQVSQNFWQYQIYPHLVKQEKMVNFKQLGNYQHIRTKNPSLHFFALAKNLDYTKLYLWSKKDNKVIATISHPATIGQVAFSRDGRILILGGDSGFIQIFDIQKKQLYNKSIFTKLAEKYRRIFGLSISPDNRLLVCSNALESMLFTLPGCKKLATFPYRGDHLNAKFTNDQKKIVIGGAQLGTYLWQLDGKKTKPSPPLLETSQTVAFSRDSKKLAYSSGPDISIWDFSSKNKTVFKRNHKDVIIDLDWSWDSRFLVSVSWENSMILWDVHKRNKICVVPTELPKQDSYFAAIAFFPKSNKWGLWNADSFTIYDASMLQQKEFNLEKHFPNKKKTILGVVDSFKVKDLTADYIKVVFSPQRRYVAYQMVFDTFLWDLHNDQIYLIGETGLISGNEARYLFFSHDDSLLACQGRRTVRIWDVKSRKLLIDSKNDMAIRAFLPDKSLVMTKSGTSSIFSGVIKDNKILIKHKSVIKNVRYFWESAMAFSHSGKLLAMGEYTIQVCKIENNRYKTLRNSDIVKSNIKAVSFVNDDKWLALGTDTGNFIIWDWQKEKVLYRFQLRDTVDKIRFDRQKQIIWVMTTNSTFLYKIPFSENIKYLYPLQIYPDYTMLKRDISNDFRYFTCITANFSLSLFDLKPFANIKK